MALSNKDKKDLASQEDKELAFFNKRKLELKEHRKSVRGINIDDLYRRADREVQLKPLTSSRNTTKGLNRGLDLKNEDNRRLNISSTKWQSDNSDASVFSKIQTALSLLFDRNPEPILVPGSKRFVEKTELAKAILMDSQKQEDFRQKLKTFVFNSAKYGVAFGRTSIVERRREYEDLVSINPVTQEKKYKKKKEVIRRVEFTPISNWNVWVDENAKPNQSQTINDWMWRAIYSDDDLISEFSNKEFKKAVEKAIKVKGKNTDQISDAIDSHSNTEPDNTRRTDLNEVYFYENKDKDMVIAVANGVKVYLNKLPAHKEISLIYTLWNLRDDLTIYGVGLPEIMRQDKNLLDKIRNMTVDQLVLSIYKMFFYDGTLDSEDAEIQIQPGRGMRVVDPSKIKFLEVPDGGRGPIEREAMLRENMEESTGISKTLSGTVQASPDVKALALLQAKEAALAKIKVALDNVLWSIGREANIRWDLIQELNMFPQDVRKIVDPIKIKEYMKEIDFNKDLFFHDESEGAVYALTYPEIGANIKQGEDGIFRSSQDRNFFFVTPDTIRWNGDIHFSAEAILVTNKELNKQMDLDMVNLLLPLLAQPPELMLKPAKQLLKLYNKDEEDWLPEHWLRPEQALAPPMPGEDQGRNNNGLDGNAVDRIQPPERVVSPRDTEPGRGNTTIVDKIMARTRGQTIPKPIV